MTHEQAMEYTRMELDLAEQCLEMETRAGNEDAILFLNEQVDYYRYVIDALTMIQKLV